MKKVSLLLAAVFAVSVFACTQSPQNLKIDAKNSKTLESSIAKIVTSLPEDKREEFEQSLMAVFFYGFQNNIDTIFKDKDEFSEEELTVYLQKALDGKTADDIISEAKKLGELMGSQAQ